MSTIWGYARISTNKQNIDRQIRNIKEAYPNAIISAEAYTGTKSDRPEWNKILKIVKPDDTIVFDSVSRMSRNSEEGFKQYEELFNKGVNLVFLKEAYINTEVYREALKNQIPTTGTDVDIILEGIRKYLNVLAKRQIEIAFDQAEKEVTDLHRRTSEGLKTAKLNGKQVGRYVGQKVDTRKAKEVREAIRKYSKDFEGSLSDVDVMKLAKCARNTYYKCKNQLRLREDDE